MRPAVRYAALIAVMLVVIPTVSSAQFRGLGRLTGTVSEEGVLEEKSDDRGAWAVSGVAKGEWHLTFQLAGFVPVGAKVQLPAELTRIAPINVVLKRVK
jgi:hypothetical protein